MVLSKGVSTSTYVRDLDSNEKFVDACAVHRNLFAAASISFKTKQPFKLEDLEHTLVRFQKNHLELQTTIKRLTETGPRGLNLFNSPKLIPKPQFWTAPQANVSFQWIQLGKNETWERAIFDNGLQATFEEDQLLWRAFYVNHGKLGSESQEGTFVLMCHCAIVDNRGLNLLLDDFAQEFDKVLNKQPYTPKEAKMFVPLLDALDDKYKQPNTWGDSLKLGLYMAHCMFIRNRSVYIARNPVPVVPDHTTRHITFNISKDVSAILLKRVKADNISVSGLIAAAGIAALHEMTCNSKSEKLKFYVTHEVNVRVFCKDFDKLNGRLDGCRCTYMETSLDATAVSKSDQLWDVASTAHAEIVPKLSSMFQSKLCKMFSEMGGDAYEINRSMSTQAVLRNDLSIAVFDDLDDVFGERDNIEINRIFGSVAVHLMCTPFKHVVHVFKGQIFYTMVYSGAYTKFDKAKEYGERTVAFLRMAAE